MKATLLIRNISSLYTCDPRQPLLSDAWIAIVHDRIVDLGTGDWFHWVDSDLTRVIDARHSAVVPAFILAGDLDQRAEGMTKTELIRELDFLFRNGITTLTTSSSLQCQHTIQQDIFYRPDLRSVCVYELSRSIPDGVFFLSLRAPSPLKLYSFQLVFASLFAKGMTEESRLLASACSIPARAAGLSERGILKKGYYANCLILESTDFLGYFMTYGVSQIRWIIHKGIPVYPIQMRC